MPSQFNYQADTREQSHEHIETDCGPELSKSSLMPGFEQSQNNKVGHGGLQIIKPKSNVLDLAQIESIAGSRVVSQNEQYKGEDIS